MSYGDKWLIVLLNDEKKWHLYGSDSCSKYWHALSKAPRTFFQQSTSWQNCDMGNILFSWSVIPSLSPKGTKFLKLSGNAQKTSASIWQPSRGERVSN